MCVGFKQNIQDLQYCMNYMEYWGTTILLKFEFGDAIFIIFDIGLYLENVNVQSLVYCCSYFRYMYASIISYLEIVLGFDIFIG